MQVFSIRNALSMCVYYDLYNAELCILGYAFCTFDSGHAVCAMGAGNSILDNESRAINAGLFILDYICWPIHAAPCMLGR
jgi:hypothetical protein